MPIFDVKDPGIRQVRARHPLLRGNRIQARGSRAAIFDGSAPDKVLKLMADLPGYMYLTDGCAPRGIHVPMVSQSFGEVGETSFGETLYLVELERLRPVPRGHAQMRAIRKAYKYSREHGYGGYDPNLPDVDGDHPWLPSSWTLFFTELNQFITSAQVSLDYSLRGNYLVRENGELVASDPVLDARAESRKAARMARRVLS